MTIDRSSAERVLEFLVRSAIVAALFGCLPRTSDRPIGPDHVTPQARRYRPETAPPTGQFWLLADSQLHNVSAGRAFLRSKAVDKRAPGAIRPPSLDLWSSAVLRTILDEMRTAATSPRPIFFLGDAVDISCTGEFENFLRTMDAASRPVAMPWFAVLGNHDGFYEGNLTNQPDPPMDRRNPRSFAIPGDKTWSGACYASELSRPARHAQLLAFERAVLIQSHEDLDTHTEQKSLAKATAVLMYLADLRRRDVLRVDPLELGSWTPSEIEETGAVVRTLLFRADGEYLVGARKLAVRVHASLTLPPTDVADDRQWRAHVVQDVELPDGAHALLLDTSDPSFPPPSKYRYLLGRAWQQLDLIPRTWLRLERSCHSTSKITFPGACGEIGALQRASIDAFMARWPAGTRFFAMGHHPLDSMRLPSERQLQQLFRQPGFVAYFSGHTHYPASTAPALGTPSWEVNIGSTTDWPMQYALVSHWTISPARSLQVDIRVPKPLATCPYADAGPELDYGDVDRYVARALVAYQRLFRWVKQDLGVAAIDAAPTTSRFACRPLGCFSHFERFLQNSLATTDIHKRRIALAELVQYDRDVLRTSTRVRQVEAACAMWASEQDFIARHSPRPTIEGGEPLPLVQRDPFLPPSTPAP